MNRRSIRDGVIDHKPWASKSRRCTGLPIRQSRLTKKNKKNKKIIQGSNEDPAAPGSPPATEITAPQIHQPNSRSKFSKRQTAFKSNSAMHKDHLPELFCDACATDHEEGQICPQLASFSSAVDPSEPALLPPGTHADHVSGIGDHDGVGDHDHDAGSDISFDSRAPASSPHSPRSISTCATIVPVSNVTVSGLVIAAKPKRPPRPRPTHSTSVSPDLKRAHFSSSPHNSPLRRGWRCPSCETVRIHNTLFCDTCNTTVTRKAVFDSPQ